MAVLKDLLSNSAGQILENLSEVGDTYISLEKIIPVVNDMLVDQAKEMRQLNKELGTGSKTSSEFRREFAKLSQNLGIGNREIYELVDSTRSYHQGIKESTASTLQFYKATNASIRVIGDFSAKLNIVGITSQETFSAMYESILSVRDAYGLTDDQVEDITNSLTQYAVVTGASDEQMKKASVTLSKFTSQLTSAGIEADKVSEIINGMLDPDRMTDNLVLMSKLGISITDMVSGDPVEKLEGSAEKLKQLGQEINNIAKTNRIQANEVAKVYGLTLEQANLLANMDTSESALNTQKKLEEYRQEMTTFTESIKNAVTMISGAIAGPLTYFTRIFEKVGNTIGMLPRGLSALLIGVTGKKILNKIVDKLGSAAKKWGQTMGEGFANYLKQVEGRYGAKQKDIKGLTPNRKDESGLEYGFGLNYKLKAEQKRDEFNRSKFKDLFKKELTPGEMMENLQSKADELNALRKKRSAMADNSEEAKLFDRTYKVRIDSFFDKFGNLINQIQESKGWSGELAEYRNIFRDDYDTLNRQQKTETTKDLINSLKVSGITGADKFGLLENDNAAKIAGISSGPKEFLEKLIEFWEASSDPKAAEYMESAKQQLNELNTKVAESVKITENYKDAVELANNALEKGAKGLTLKDRIGSLISGVGTNIGTFFLRNAKKFIGLGIGGGITTIIGLISKMEPVQEVIASVSETISGFLESIKPAVEAISNFIIKYIVPPINWIFGIVGKIANFFGAKLTKDTKNISDSVSKIEDTYKQEDLKTMIGGAAVYNKNDDELLAKLDNIYYKITDVTKKQDEANDNSVAQQLQRANA